MQNASRFSKMNLITNTRVNRATSREERRKILYDDKFKDKPSGFICPDCLKAKHTKYGFRCASCAGKNRYKKEKKKDE